MVSRRQLGVTQPTSDGGGGGGGRGSAPAHGSAYLRAGDGGWANGTTAHGGSTRGSGSGDSGSGGSGSGGGLSLVSGRQLSITQPISDGGGGSVGGRGAARDAGAGRGGGGGNGVDAERDPLDGTSPATVRAYLRV